MITKPEKRDWRKYEMQSERLGYFETSDCKDLEIFDLSEKTAERARLYKITNLFVSFIEGFYPEQAKWLVDNYINKEDYLLCLYGKYNTYIERCMINIFDDDFEWLIQNPKVICDIIYITSTGAYESWDEFMEDPVEEIKKIYEDTKDPNCVFIWLKNELKEDYPF